MGKQLTIKLENQSLEVIDDCGILKSNNILQLVSWGFKKARRGQVYEINSPEIDRIFIRLLEHFKKKNIAYVLTPATEPLLKNIFSRSQSFQETKDKAANFKNGSFDHKDFNNFMDFISKNIVRDLKEHQVKASYYQSI